jgi:nucleoside-diphosphate-sugar epimerase
MKVLLAGASGAIGIPLTRQLVAAGYEVIGLSRTTTNHDKLVMMTSTLRVSNARARRELGWTPSMPTYRDGIRRMTTLPREAA